MKHEEYLKLLQFAKVGEGLIPANSKAIDIIQNLESGEVVYMKKSQARDIKLHNCYFSLLAYIHSFLPSDFKKQVKVKHFYKWLKTAKGEYDIIYEFKNHPAQIEYISISFSKMDNLEFKEYVKEQMPYILYKVIPEFYKNNLKKAIKINDNIEENYESFFSVLDNKEYKKKQT
jgi:hypothetical protein